MNNSFWEEIENSKYKNVLKVLKLQASKCFFSQMGFSRHTYHALFVHCGSLGPVYEFVCISFRTDNLNCFRAS